MGRLAKVAGGSLCTLGDLATRRKRLGGVLLYIARAARPARAPVCHPAAVRRQLGAGKVDRSPAVLMHSPLKHPSPLPFCLQTTGAFGGYSP